MNWLLLVVGWQRATIYAAVAVCKRMAFDLTRPNMHHAARINYPAWVASTAEKLWSIVNKLQ